MKRLFAATLLAMLLCACQMQPSEPSTEPIPTVTETRQTNAPVTIYSGATKHFLGDRGNGYDFSWEAEFPLEYVMIHFCSAVVEHPDDPYNMEYVRQTFIDADVSIHYIIDREGTVFCYVPESRRAWHAGVGEWLDDERYTNKMNFYSVGIELVGIGSQKDMAQFMTKSNYRKLDKSLIGFTDAQYDALKLLVEDVCRRNNIPLNREHVIGHQDFSPKKSDPGELFDWSRILP